MAGGLVELGDGIAARIRPAPGERVLWFHGYTMDSSTWEELWDHLPGWHHIGVDLPGHGASRPLARGDDLPGVARLMAALALEHGVRHLAALSFGTILALQAAVERPDAFATLVLAAPALGGGPTERVIEARYEELARSYRERGPGPHLGALWMAPPPDIFRGVQANEALWDRVAAVVARHSWSELERFGMHPLTGHVQAETDLRTIRSATLILLGEEDMQAFKRSAELIRRSIPRSRRVYLPGAGHLCMLEAPRRAARLIDAHLRGAG